MADYKVSRSVIDASLEELAEIFHWVHALDNPEDPATVLNSHALSGYRSS